MRGVVRNEERAVVAVGREDGAPVTRGPGLPATVVVLAFKVLGNLIRLDNLMVTPARWTHPPPSTRFVRGWDGERKAKGGENPR